jgi:hypothetical protein
MFLASLFYLGSRNILRDVTPASFIYPTTLPLEKKALSSRIEMMKLL